ncbi:hypothetical protein E4099_16930, partial [Streptomyces palmae]
MDQEQVSLLLEQSQRAGAQPGRLQQFQHPGLVPPQVAYIAAGQFGSGVRAGLFDDDLGAGAAVGAAVHPAVERVPDDLLDQVPPVQEDGSGAGARG